MPDENTSGLNSSVCAVLRQKIKCWKGDGKKWLCFICEIFCSDPSERHWTPLPRQLSLSLEPVIIFMQAEQSLCRVEPLSLHVHISIEHPGLLLSSFRILFLYLNLCVFQEPDFAFRYHHANEDQYNSHSDS